MRGRAWDAKGQYERAIADYDEAIRLDPNNALAYASRGYSWHGNLGTVRDIVDTTSTIVGHFVYDSFGNVAYQSGTVPHWGGFAGYHVDTATGLLNASLKNGRIVTRPTHLPQRGKYRANPGKHGKSRGTNSSL